MAARNLSPDDEVRAECKNLFSPEDRELLEKDAKGELVETEERRSTRNLLSQRARVAELNECIDKMQTQLAPSETTAKVVIGPGSKIQAPDVQQRAGDANSEETLGIMENTVKIHPFLHAS